MEMSRDVFLELMISELQSMKGSDGLFKEKETSISDVLAKLEYDFPALDDKQLSQLTEFIVSLRSPHDQNSFYLSEKFLENISYINTSPSYSSVTQQVSALCESVYVTLPVCMFQFSKSSLIYLLHGPDVTDVEWYDLLVSIKSLVQLSSASTLGPVRINKPTACPALRKESIDGIRHIVSFVVHTVCDTVSSVHSSDQSSTPPHTLEAYLRSVPLSPPHPSVIDTNRDNTTIHSSPTPLGLSLDIAGHLLFLLRDLAAVSPVTGLEAVPPLLDCLMDLLGSQPAYVGRNSSQRSNTKKENITGGTTAEDTDAMEAALLQIHMTVFFWVTQVTSTCGDVARHIGDMSLTKEDETTWGTCCVFWMMAKYTIVVAVSCNTLCMRVYWC